MKVTALLTGRGNNTLKDKNVLDVLGHPVLYYPAIAAKESGVINEYYCSSDDEKILQEAYCVGYEKIVRPQELALPTSQHIDCIMHALSVIENTTELPDILVVLLANNVTVKPQWIADCVNKMKQNPDITAVVPVYKDNDHHPLRANRLNGAGMLEMYTEPESGSISTNRQDLPACYFLAHNFWVLNVEYLRTNKGGQPPWTFMGDKILPYPIEESIDIHSPIDLILAAEWIKENL